MKFYRCEKWDGQTPVRSEIAAEEAERLLETIRQGSIYLSTRPRLDGKVTVEVPMTWGDLYVKWLHQERGSYASWDGPICSYEYFTTYVYRDAGGQGEPIPRRFRAIRYMPEVAACP